MGWVAVLAAAAAIAAGCSSDLDVSEHTFACNSQAECIDGYYCTGLQSGHDTGVCVSDDDLDADPSDIPISGDTLDIHEQDSQMDATSRDAEQDSQMDATPGDAMDASDASVMEDNADARADAGVDVSPGCQVPADSGSSSGTYRVVFLTRDTWQGNLGGVPGADEKCQTAALAAYGGDDDGQAGATGIPLLASEDTGWRAIISGPSQDAVDTIDIEEQIVRPDGTCIAVNSDEFWSGSHSAPIQQDAFGNTLSGMVWTGTSTSGNKSGPFCADDSSSSPWNTTNSAKTGRVGNSNEVGYEWINAGKKPCGTADDSGDDSLDGYHLYCISASISSTSQ